MYCSRASFSSCPGEFCRAHASSCHTERDPLVAFLRVKQQLSKAASRGQASSTLKYASHAASPLSDPAPQEHVQIMDCIHLLSCALVNPHQQSCSSSVRSLFRWDLNASDVELSAPLTSPAGCLKIHVLSPVRSSLQPRSTKSHPGDKQSSSPRAKVVGC